MAYDHRCLGCSASCLGGKTLTWDEAAGFAELLPLGVAFNSFRKGLTHPSILKHVSRFTFEHKVRNADGGVSRLRVEPVITSVVDKTLICPLNGDDRRCRVYESRPVSCRNLPCTFAVPERDMSVMLAAFSEFCKGTVASPDGSFYANGRLADPAVRAGITAELASHVRDFREILAPFSEWLERVSAPVFLAAVRTPERAACAGVDTSDFKRALPAAVLIAYAMHRGNIDPEIAKELLRAQQSNLITMLEAEDGSELKEWYRMAFDVTNMVIVELDVEEPWRQEADSSAPACCERALTYFSSLSD